MKNLKAKIGIWLLLLFSTGAWCDFNLALTDDAWINANNPTSSFGAASDIFVHNWGPKYGLVRFDASVIAGENIDSATLTLYLNDIAAAGTISLHAVTSSWSESTVTWNNQPMAEAVAIAVRTLAPADEGTAIAIDVTSVVQRWSDGILADAGFLIVTSDSIKAYFDTKERPGGMRAVLRAETAGSTPPSGKLPVVLDFSTLPVVIDEPGHYVLDRDWRIDTEMAHRLIAIEADDVTLDFQGFALYMLNEGNVVIVSGRHAVLRDGTIENTSDSTGVLSTAEHTVLERMSVRAESVARLSSRAVVRHSTLVGRTGVSVGSDSIVEFNRFLSTFTCLFAAGDNIRLNDNTMDGGEYVVRVTGSDNIVARNTITPGDWPGGLLLDGERNAIEANVFKGYPWGISEPAIVVDGTANILRGNLALPAWDEPVTKKWSLGIRFFQSGNYYGNNQMAAIVPFDLGTTAQIDWGGNIGF